MPTHWKRRTRTVVALFLMASLGACGGGGGGADTASRDTTTAADRESLALITTGLASTTRDAVRLLDQAAFGPTPAGVTEALKTGAEEWVDLQLAQAPTGYAPIDYINPNSSIGCPTGSPSTCYRDNYTPFPLQLQFFRNAVYGPDQLRQRVAFAYSQIFTLSGIDIKETYGMRAYQQMLLENAFGNFRTLLQRVTLSPAMGDYLDMVNNAKPNPARGIQANENFAREILQLFSIGLVQLNPDGSPVTDGNGAEVPTYEQATVTGFANAFTGWTYAARPGVASRWTNPKNYEGEMVAFDAFHDVAAKTLLDGRVLPAGQSAAKDLSDALDTIANHPNVGPFIGRQLIQFLVTSNPSPSYVARVSSVFANNGQGVRGDMGAVVRAILLDDEARGDVKTDVAYGKLREPAVFVASVARAFGAQTDGVYLNAQSAAMGQSVFSPPSVFSYFPPDYALPGSSTLVAPQFGIQNTPTTVTRLNFTYSLMYSANGIAPDASVPGSIGTKISFADYQGSAPKPTTLVDRLGTALTHATLTQAEKTAIVGAVSSIAATDTLGRTRMAAYLVAASPRYQITR